MRTGIAQPDHRSLISSIITTRTSMQHSPIDIINIKLLLAVKDLLQAIVVVRLGRREDLCV